MNPMEKPSVTVVHSLPGRVRLRFSRAVENPARLTSAVREHPGMGRLAYTPQTRSLLIEFDARAVSRQEIALRAAFQFSLDQGAAPVRLLAAPEEVTLEDSALLAAVGLGVSLANRWLQPGRKELTWLDWTAGFGTAWSIAEHGWKELKRRGYFDPEVLTLAYLVAALVRGNFLTASVVTWLTTFGRHLIQVPPTGVEVWPREVQGESGEPSQYELVVRADPDVPERTRILEALQGALKYAMTGGGARELRTLWEELREVSRVHGEVLEGSGPMREGIPVRFQAESRGFAGDEITSGRK